MEVGLRFQRLSDHHVVRWKRGSAVSVDWGRWGDRRVQRLSDSQIVRWEWGDSRAQQLSDRHLIRWKWGDSRVQRLGDRHLGGGATAVCSG